MSIEKKSSNISHSGLSNTNLNVRGWSNKTYDEKIGLRGDALGEIMGSNAKVRKAMSEEEIQKIKNFFINNLPPDNLNHFDISEFSMPDSSNRWGYYPIPNEVRSKICKGILEIRKKNGDVVNNNRGVVSNQTLKARSINKRIGLPFNLLNRIIDRNAAKPMKTIKPEQFKKIDEFFRTHLPGNPNLLEESDIVRVNRLGKELGANDSIKAKKKTKAKKTKPLYYSITDTVFTKIKECINAIDITENIETPTDLTKKRTNSEFIDNSNTFSSYPNKNKEYTDQPQNERFPEQIANHSLKKARTTSQIIDLQILPLLEENTVLTTDFQILPLPKESLVLGSQFFSQFLPENMSFLSAETTQPNNVETETEPSLNLQSILSEPTASGYPTPFLLDAIQSPLLNQSRQNEQIDPLSYDPFLFEEEKRLPDSDTHKQFDELFNFTPEDELFLPAETVQTPSSNHQASSAQLLLDDLLLPSSTEDDLFPLGEYLG